MKCLPSPSSPPQNPRFTAVWYLWNYIPLHKINVQEWKKNLLFSFVNRVDPKDEQSMRHLEQFTDACECFLGYSPAVTFSLHSRSIYHRIMWSKLSMNLILPYCSHSKPNYVMKSKPAILILCWFDKRISGWLTLGIVSAAKGACRHCRKVAMVQWYLGGEMVETWNPLSTCSCHYL